MKTSAVTPTMDKSLESQTILIVEDDALTRELVRLVLGEAGYAVDTAPDGGDALELLQRSSPNVILLDMTLPGMGSRAFVHAYRKLPTPHAPIIIFTAADALRAAEFTEEVSAAGFLLKPFDLNELVQTMDRVRQRSSVG